MRLWFKKNDSRGDEQVVRLRFSRRRGSETPRKHRPDTQGGGVYTKPALAVRRVRSRKRNAAARQARKANRR